MKIEISETPTNIAIEKVPCGDVVQWRGLFWMVAREWLPVGSPLQFALRVVGLEDGFISSCPPGTLVAPVPAKVIADEG